MSRHKTKLPANSANRQSPSRKGMLRSPYFAWLASVLAIELIFALSIPDTILTELPALGRWTKFVAGFFPAVGNFNAIARHPEAVAFFLSIAPLFMLPKVYIAYRWLNSDYLGTYRHLVISPLTMHQPAGREFFTGDAAKTK